MSHPTGKIEFIGPASEDAFLFKYQQAKSDKDQGRIFKLCIADDQLDQNFLCIGERMLLSVKNPWEQ